MCVRVHRRANPYGEFYLDGVSLNPFEVLFVKVRQGRGVRAAAEGQLHPSSAE